MFGWAELWAESGARFVRMDFMSFPLLPSICIITIGVLLEVQSAVCELMESVVPELIIVYVNLGPALAYPEATFLRHYLN